ncbi:RWD domain-containing protein 3 isoform X2 [Trichomycterus rosablanca]|uniref:RWD domain-containing protein 3 isoform X2 n=1 Tax=Trichomycterus rosablanca TaxID=2290929 RepID=UPI002F35756E
MCEEALDEMSVLSAIYCGKDEFELIEHSAQTGLVYRIRTAVETKSGCKVLDLVFHVSPEYPQTPPDISVTSSDLSRTQCQDLRKALLSEAHGLPPEPMVHQLVTWLQQSFTGLIAAPDWQDRSRTPDGTAEETWITLLHLDHMRSKARYVRLIEKWTSELDLTGRLFMGKPTLILLQGTKKSIKEYVHLQRTVKVDVDSSGKRCKERMMKVLCEVPLTDDFTKISAFEVKQVPTLEELQKEFDLVGSLKLYHQFVPFLL